VASTPLEPLSRALDLFGQLLTGVGPEQWSRPTPCDAWNVHQLVDHVVSGQRLAAEAVRGQSAPPASGNSSRDDAPDDAVAAYQASAAALLSACAEPGALERVVTVPAGTLPGAVVVHLRTTEAIVHGWDLARATGLPFDVPSDLAEGELAFSRPLIERMPPGRGTFAPPRPSAEDAPVVERLVALLGRDPAWAGPPD
jgi:uncharacterized protein (TIGR03086 family)